MSGRVAAGSAKTPLTMAVASPAGAPEQTTSAPPASDPAAGGTPALDGSDVRGDGVVFAEREPDGELAAQRDAPVGGQAVLEGVMMRGVSNWAVAPALGEIEVTSYPLDSAMRRHRLLRLPIIRGVVALGGSMAIGFRALEVSANAQLPAEEEQEIPRGVWAGTVLVAILLAIVLFFLIPVGLTSLIKGQLGSSVLFWLIEGIVRTAL